MLFFTLLGFSCTSAIWANKHMNSLCLYLSPTMNKRRDRGNRDPNFSVSVKCLYLGWMDVGYGIEEPEERLVSFEKNQYNFKSSQCKQKYGVWHRQGTPRTCVIQRCHHASIYSCHPVSSHQPNLATAINGFLMQWHYCRNFLLGWTRLTSSSV